MSDRPWRSTSAHQFGIWWHKQRPAGKDGHPSFQKMDLFPGRGRK
jgi:hypothetical protein